MKADIRNASVLMPFMKNNIYEFELNAPSHMD